MPSWAAPSPTTQATKAKASKVFHRTADMALVGKDGQGLGTHCIYSKARKANNAQLTLENQLTVR